MFPASICLVSPKTTYSYLIIASAAGSGGGGSSDLTTSEYHQPTDWEGSGLRRCWCWFPLTLWHLGPGSVSGPPPSPVSAPERSYGVMRRWLGSVFLRWQPRSSLRLACGSLSTVCSSPGVSTGRVAPPPPLRDNSHSCDLRQAHYVISQPVSTIVLLVMLVSVKIIRPKPQICTALMACVSPYPRTSRMLRVLRYSYRGRGGWWRSGGGSAWRRSLPRPICQVRQIGILVGSLANILVWTYTVSTAGMAL